MCVYVCEFACACMCVCVCVCVCVGEGECDASTKCMGHYIQILGSPKILKCIQSGMPPGMYRGG